MLVSFSKDDNVHSIEVTMTSYSYEEERHGSFIVSSEDYTLKIESVPEGSTEQEVEDFAMSNHGSELIEEYHSHNDWVQSGMEFHHYN